MDKYKIPCTEEQTRKALALGAPIKTIEKCGKLLNSIILNENEECYTLAIIPTAEEMIGWLEEQGILLNIEYQIDGYCNISLQSETKIFYTTGSIKRNIATLTSIDATLDYLIKHKNND